MTLQGLFNALVCWLALCLTFASTAAPAETQYSGVILVYHHIAEDTPAITSISPEDFEAQLDFLEAHQFEVWPLEQLVRAQQERAPVPNKVVALTFDDNYRSVYEQAYPRLKQRGWPFTIFVSTDAVDKNINMQSSWPQMREMAKHGATIANHTASHAHLLQRMDAESDSDWRQRVKRDIETAQRRIKQEIGRTNKLFAYPYGEFNPTLVAWIEELGYIGIGQQSGPVSALSISGAIPRFPFAGKYTNIDDFALKVLTLPLPLNKVDFEPGPLSFSNTRPTLQLSFATGDYDPRRLRCYGSGQGQLTLKWKGDWKVEVIPEKDIPVGRSKFNCTLPSDQRSNSILRYHWFSHTWIRATKTGELID